MKAVKVVSLVLVAVGTTLVDAQQMAQPQEVEIDEFGSAIGRVDMGNLKEVVEGEKRSLEANTPQLNADIEDEEDEIEDYNEARRLSHSTKAPSIKSTKAPSIKSTKAPSIKSTKAPSIKSTKAPSIKSTKAPSIKSTKAPSIKSTKAPSTRRRLLEENEIDEDGEQRRLSHSTKAPSIKSTKAPSIKSTKAPSIKSTKAPSIKSTKAPSIKSTKAPSIKSTKAPSIKSTKAPSASRRTLKFDDSMALKNRGN